MAFHIKEQRSNANVSYFQKTCNALGVKIGIATGVVGGITAALHLAKKTAVCQAVTKYVVDELGRQPFRTKIVTGIISEVTCLSSASLLGAISGGVVAYLLVNSISRRVFHK